jgi:hypothetical protein
MLKKTDLFQDSKINVVEKDEYALQQYAEHTQLMVYFGLLECCILQVS